MRKFISKNGVVLLILLILNLILNTRISAQISSSGIATSIKINGEANDGDIICSTSDGYKACSQEYDTEITGVIVKNPSAAFIEDEQGNSQILSSGKTVVRVSTINGKISAGSLITTSVKPGIGELSTRNGYVLGTALEDFKSDDVNQIGTIVVEINIHPAAGLSGAKTNLVQALRQGLRAPLFDPLDTLRYFIAALMILISFTLGFIYFGRVAKTGIEAIGRNPLAGRLIQISILLHIVITIVIVLVGLAIAYLILIL